MLCNRPAAYDVIDYYKKAGHKLTEENADTFYHTLFTPNDIQYDGDVNIDGYPIPIWESTSDKINQPHKKDIVYYQPHGEPWTRFNFDDLDKYVPARPDGKQLFISMAGYIGNKGAYEDSIRHIHALEFPLYYDKDWVQETLDNLTKAIAFKKIPNPTYIVAEEQDLRIVYVLESAFYQTKTVYKSLQRMYKHLARIIHINTANDSRERKHDLIEAFPMVGSITPCGVPVRAFRVGNTFASINDLNKFVPLNYRAKDGIAKTRLEYAIAEYPEWAMMYVNNSILMNHLDLLSEENQEIVKSNPDQKKPIAPIYYYSKRNLLTWYIEKLPEWCDKNIEELEERRRAYLWCAVVFGMKSRLPEDVTQKYLYLVKDILNSKLPEGAKKVTEEMVDNAMTVYDHPEYIKTTRERICELLNVTILPKKSNGRTMHEHLSWCGKMCHINGTDGSRKNDVYAYFTEHPKASAKECAAALSCDVTTARKWRRDMVAKNLLEYYSEVKKKLKKAKKTKKTAKKKVDHRVFCKECGKRVTLETAVCYELKWGKYPVKITRKFCPKCGALLSQKIETDTREEEKNPDYKTPVMPHMKPKTIRKIGKKMILQQKEDQRRREEYRAHMSTTKFCIA